MKVIMYCSHFYKIGGIETFVYNFAKRMCKTYDLTVVYEAGDPAQISRIRKYCKVEKYVGQEMETDVVIYATAWGARPIDKIKAKKKYQMIHADWEQFNLRTKSVFKFQEGIDGYVSVSKQAAVAFEKMYGVKSQVIYNLLDLEQKIDKVLIFITASRIGVEKGFERMAIMAEKLKQKGKKFIWWVFGDISSPAYKERVFKFLGKHPEFVIMPPRLDILGYIKRADYLVQLSDTEAFCYSIYEALQLGTPCIVTEFPSAYEQVKPGENGYIVKFDLSDLDADKIFDEIPKNGGFVEKSTEKDWIKLIGEPREKPPKYVFKDSVMVKVKSSYFDIELDRRVNIDEEFETTNERAKLLIEKNKCVLL